MGQEILWEDVQEMFRYLVTVAGLSFDAAVTALDKLNYDYTLYELKEIYEGKR